MTVPDHHFDLVVPRFLGLIVVLLGILAISGPEEGEELLSAGGEGKGLGVADHGVLLVEHPVHEGQLVLERHQTVKAPLELLPDGLTIQTYFGEDSFEALPDLLPVRLWLLAIIFDGLLEHEQTLLLAAVLHRLATALPH